MEAERPECTRCGGPLPTGDGRRSVACQYCSQVQEHPRPLEVGQEVLTAGRFRGRFELGRVSACASADAIHVALGDEGTTVKRLEDLLRVAPVDQAVVGMQVFRRAMHGWELTHVSSVDGVSVRVQHSSAGFSDPFFDDTVVLHDLRIPLDPAARHTRSLAERIIARVKDDPVGVAFNLLPVVGALALASCLLSAFLS